MIEKSKYYDHIAIIVANMRAMVFARRRYFGLVAGGERDRRIPRYGVDWRRAAAPHLRPRKAEATAQV